MKLGIGYTLPQLGCSFLKGRHGWCTRGGPGCSGVKEGPSQYSSGTWHSGCGGRRQGQIVGAAGSSRWSKGRDEGEIGVWGVLKWKQSLTFFQEWLGSMWILA